MSSPLGPGPPTLIVVPQYPVLVPLRSRRAWKPRHQAPRPTTLRTLTPLVPDRPGGTTPPPLTSGTRYGRTNAVLPETVLRSFCSGSPRTHKSHKPSGLSSLPPVLGGLTTASSSFSGVDPCNTGLTYRNSLPSSSAGARIPSPHRRLRRHRVQGRLGLDEHSNRS